jgi:hypothetical protein
LVVQTQQSGDDGSKQRKRQKILEFVRRSPRVSKKFISILCASIALRVGLNVEPAHAVAKTTIQEVTPATTETKKSFPPKKGVVLVTGSAAVFAGVRAGKRVAGRKDGDTEEKSTMKIPKRRSLEQLQQTRVQKQEKVEEEMAEIVEKEGLAPALEKYSTLDNEIEEKMKPVMELQADWDFLMADAANIEFPLIDEQFVEARRQPKKIAEESALAAKYAAIDSLEDRAYRILLDLELIKETAPIDIDEITAILDAASW